MLEIPSSSSPILLQEASARNHREYFVELARASGGEVRESPGIIWTYGGAAGESMIPFPEMAGSSPREQLDAVVEYYLDRKPNKMVGCWSLDPPQPPELEAYLLARGFQPGWRPHFMALDLDALEEVPAPTADVSIVPVQENTGWDVTDLPYYTAESAAVHQLLQQQSPRRLWRFAAMLRGKPVGHCTLYITPGPSGSAGIYDVGVVPPERGKGIGKAVTAAACLAARERGCKYALLNATGERMYRQLGFEFVGEGWTWWLNVQRLLERRPDPDLVSLTEAVARGEPLDSFGTYARDLNLNQPLANDMTLIGLAVHCKQNAAAEWLIERGAALDLLSAWDLGWKDRVSSMARDPALLNGVQGDSGESPLHVAVERDDVELVTLLLEAGADLDAKDSVYKSTPLTWAKHLHRDRLVPLIEERTRNS